MTLVQAASIAAAIAGVCSIGALLPQIYRVVTRRSADDLSLSAYLIATLAAALWTFYGYVNRIPEVLIVNAISVVLFVLIIGLILRFGGPR